MHLKFIFAVFDEKKKTRTVIWSRMVLVARPDLWFEVHSWKKGWTYFCHMLYPQVLIFISGVVVVVVVVPRPGTVPPQISPKNCHPVFHGWTSNKRSGRATTTIRLQMTVRVFFCSSNITNIHLKYIKICEFNNNQHMCVYFLN